jgi:hypothetical protein
MKEKINKIKKVIKKSNEDMDNKVLWIYKNMSIMKNLKK